MARRWSADAPALSCFKLPSFHLCTRVDLEQRARYPWINGTDAECDGSDLEDGDALAGGVPSHQDVASGSFCSVSSGAQVLPKKLNQEDWPVRQPSLEALEEPEDLDPEDLDGEAGACPPPETPPAVDVAPSAVSPTSVAEPSASEALLLLPKPIRTIRAAPIPFELGAGISRGAQSAKAAPGPAAEPGRDGARALSLEVGSRRGQMVKVGTQTVELGSSLLGRGGSTRGGQFDPLYGSAGKQALPTKTVKLLVKHNRKASWPSPAPQFESSTLYMTRRKNKHPNFQIHIQSSGPSASTGAGQPGSRGACKWSSEVKRAEENIRRTLVGSGEDGPIGRDREGDRGTAPWREGDRVPDSPETIAHMRRTWDARESGKSLHTLLAAMDLAAAVANTRCCKTGGGERVGGVGGGGMVLQGGVLGQQRSSDAPRREFDLARVLRSGPRTTVAFPQSPDC